MDPHHRKVDLQAPADLVYLHNNIKAVAQQKLDLAIPPQGEDAFRNQVQELVQEVFCLLTPPAPQIKSHIIPPFPSIPKRSMRSL